jgi:glycosyltransferase involved in cell wall biosynthesis
MPSLWYETFGRVIMEAFAVGTPVVATRLGAMTELVTEGVTGALVEPGNTAELAATVDRLVAVPERLAQMRRSTRFEFERKYTSARNHQLLIDIYRRAIDLAGKSAHDRAQARHVPAQT